MSTYDDIENIDEPLPVTHSRTYTFGQALDRVINGHAMRRLSWPDDGTYIVLNDGILKIFIPFTKEMRPLLVSFADMTGEDWVTV